YLRPVVATWVGGVAELVSDCRTGVLVPPGDPSALAAGIERLLLDPEEARTMAQRARERIESAFVVETSARQLAEACRAVGRPGVSQIDAETSEAKLVR